MDKTTKQEIIAKYGRSEGDTGSPEVQIALLTARINELTEHLVTIANSKFSDKEYTASDFDYYKNDGLLLQATPGFFKENMYSLKEK